MSKYSNRPCIGELSDESFVFKEVIWKVSKEYIVPNIVNYFVPSPAFAFAGATWALHVLPYGRVEFDSIGWIDLGIERLSSNISEHTVYCKFYFKTNRGKVFEPYQESYIFNEKSKISSMLYQEKKDFFPKQKALINEGVLTIVCQMRTQTINGIEAFSQTELVEPIAELTEKKSAQESLPHRSRRPRFKNLERTEKKSALDSLPPRFRQLRLKNLKLTEKESAQEFPPPASRSIELAEKESAQEFLPPASRSIGCDCISRPFIILPSSKTFTDFKELFLKQEDCDAIIKVKGREFLAHKNILKARSPVFASTFRNDMKEKATGVIDIEDCDPSSFSDFLCFLYCGSTEDLSTENVFSLFTTADKYDVQDLRSECMEFIKNNLSVDTFCNTLTLALRHFEKELIELAAGFFAKNLQEIIVTVEWQSFILENPIQSNELMIKALVSNKK